MQTSPDLKPGRESGTTSESGYADPAAIQIALDNILQSKHFRTSRQCTDLLRYIVLHSLRQEDASLKERVIGTEVFGRSPAYDTGEDPVVRVRAADTRKRLAQYYQDREHGLVSWQIELQPGSYRATFRREQPPEIIPAPDCEPAVMHSVVEPMADSRNLSRPLMASVLLLVVAFAAILGFVLTRKSPQQLFWAPVTQAKQPILLYLGSNATYIFTPDYLTRYRAAHDIPNNGPEFFVSLPPDSSIRASDIVAAPDTFVTVGDLAATVQTTTLLNEWSKPFILRSGRDVAFGDLRNRPSIFIGGFNNPWTLEVTSDLPFSFKQGTNIEEKNPPRRVWSMKPRAGSSTDDYALISRLIVSKTGGSNITIAGIGEFGTQAAAEFVSNPDKMKDLLKSAPSGWENKNMQAVLHIKVVGYAPVAVEVVATAYW